MKILFISFIIFFLILSNVTPTFAQEKTRFDITVSPIYFDVMDLPGTEVSDTLRVYNNASVDMPLKLEVKKMVAYGDDGGVRLEDTTDDDDYLSWITFDKTEFVAPSGEWTELHFAINIPEEAAFGYYFALVLSPSADALRETVDTQLLGGIATPVLLNVTKDGAIVSGRIESFTTTSHFYEYLPVTFKTTFFNGGNVHVRPRGNIFIQDWFGREVGTIDLNKENGTVLPDSSRSFESHWNDGFISLEEKIQDGKTVIGKDGKPTKQLKIRWEKLLDFRIGYYTAKAVMVVSGQNRDIPFEETVSFWVFPWKIVIGATVILILLGVGLFSTVKNIILSILRLFKKKQV